MPTCSYCNERFWFGGVKNGNRRFCNQECQHQGALLDIADQLPPEAVDSYVRAMQLSNCPQCDGPGPIEVHTSYRVWSAVIMTGWSNRPRISCKKCATKAQLGNMAFSTAFGWWGFPWGLIMTPVQIGRNFAGMFYKPAIGKPSPQLVKFLKLNLASNLIAQQQPDAAGGVQAGR